MHRELALLPETPRLDLSIAACPVDRPATRPESRPEPQPKSRPEPQPKSRPEPQPESRPAPRRHHGTGLAAERLALIAADLVVMAVAGTAAGAAWATILIWTLPLAVALAATGRYRIRLRYSALDNIPSMLVGLAVVVAVAASLRLPVALTPQAFPGQPVAWLAVLLVGLFASRAVTGRGLSWWRARHGQATLVIGSGDLAVRLAEGLRDERGLGLAPLGLVGERPVLGDELPVPLLGGVAELDAIVEAYRPRAVVVAFAGVPDAELVAALRRCRRSGVAVYLVPRLFDLSVGHYGAELVGGIPLVRMRPDPANLWRRAAKRMLDVAGALVGLVVLAPVLAACALAVRWESGRTGVLFRQERIGRSGKPFTILKLRSLTPATAGESQVRWSIADDTRVGPVGRVLRGSSLDELPQLINVLRGDMSLVGPRPERPFFVDQFQRIYKGYGDRHRVPVGITGWAQIHGLRGDTSIEERVRFDNYYVENWSVWLDVKIIVRTAGSMLSLRRR